MSDAALSVRLSPEETARFGIVCARADHADAARLGEIMAFCAREGVQLLILRCDVRAVATVQHLEQLGFRLMDTLVHTALELARPVVIPSPESVSTSLARPQDAGVVGALSRSAFADHVGHYHADPRLSPTAAAEAYGEWAERLCQTSNEDQPCFVAHDASGLLGFAALRTARPDQVDCELCAVAGRARRRGVFRALMATAGRWAAARRYAKLTYSTQIQNIVALRAVTSLGFRYERACYTFHKWFEPDT